MCLMIAPLASHMASSWCFGLSESSGSQPVGRDWGIEPPCHVGCISDILQIGYLRFITVANFSSENGNQNNFMVGNHLDIRNWIKVSQG